MHEPVDQRHLTVVLVAGRREHDAEVLLRERLRGAGEDGREVRGEDERDEHADEPGTAGGEPAGAAVRAVALLPDDRRDELPGLRRDVAPPVEDARDGGDRDAGQLGHLPDRHPRRALVAIASGVGQGHSAIEAGSGTFRNNRFLRIVTRA